MRSTSVPAGALAALALTLTACGGDSSEASNASVSLTGSDRSTASAAPVSSSVERSVESSAPGSRAATTEASRSERPAPAVRVTPGALVSGEGFLKPGDYSTYQFTAGGGRWTCVVTQKTAGCTGPLGRGAQAGADGVQVTEAGKVSFTGTGAKDFVAKGGAKELPAGRSLPNGKFVCAAITGGVQCETASSSAGFKLTEGESARWG
ncbi:MAG: hypothetical protein QM809_01765 [Gordonia sp. (in: high G+C Gram-positive bacteria)]|uniref:hypothetical protein n=1 Tax=Gordonia sp. (in: high G+C Gram-positive bacteria) TaxID=84139 RepID=UPI0039E2323A